MKVSHTIWLLVIVFTFHACQDDKSDPFIAVNLLGYDTDKPKEAFTVNTAEKKEYELIRTDSEEVVATGISGSLKPAKEITGDSLSVIDFSSVNQTGNFILRLKEQPEIKSDPFSIKRNIYKDAAFTALESFYYNRCGTAVDNGGPWKHPVCHLDDAVFYNNPEQSRDVRGGWHDAGDYGKFSINTALSVGLLLNLYEKKAKLFSDGQLHIPSSQNGVPDILDEIRWALEWMMKMQDSNGGVFHKVSQKKWVGEFLPHTDPEERYIFRISSNATAGFTAVAALGAQIYDRYDQDFADALNKAALKGWDYLERHPVSQPLGGFSNPKDVIGGEYSDHNDKDVRMWAAVELYKQTGDEKFLRYFVKTYPQFQDSALPPLSFKNFETLAFSTFLHADLPNTDTYHRTQTKILDQFKSHAETILWQYKNNNYRTLLQSDEYYWGSTGVNLAYAFNLIQLHEITSKQKYYKAALDQLHYILGRNPLNQSFVTGLGSEAVEDPYHQFSMKLGEELPVPGMMIGGPNDQIKLNGETISQFPGKSYVDNARNYYVNEPAINWTAIFAYTAGYFSSPNRILSQN